MEQTTFGRDYFYYSTQRQLVVAFATIFDGMHIKDGFNRLITVPLHYSPRQKWLENLQNNPNLDTRDYDITLPRMGFEFLSMQFDAGRHLNPLHRIDDVMTTDEENARSFMYNRVPYNWNVALYIAAERFEHLLQIIEQIVPFFTPELNLTLKDIDNFNLETNIPVILNAIDYNIDYEGTFDTQRIVSATLQFSMKGYQYSNIRVLNRIKTAITTLHNADYDRMYERLMSQVNPPTANKSDTYTIEDSDEIITRPADELSFVFPPVPDTSTPE
jgi:hypothetical protein